MTWFIVGLIIGMGIGWVCTRFYYSSHAKKEVTDVLNGIGK